MKSGDSPAEERGDLSFSVDQQIPQSPIMNSPSYDKSCASSSVGQQMPSSSSMERTSSQLTDEEMGSKPSLKGKSKQALALFNYLDSRRSSENAEHEFALLQCRCISLAYRTFRDPCMKEELSKHVLNGIKSFLLSIGRVGDYPLSLKVYCDAALGGRLEEARLTNSDTWTRALQKGRDFFKSNLEGYTIQWCGFVLSLIQVACRKGVSDKVQQNSPESTERELWCSALGAKNRQDHALKWFVYTLLNEYSDIKKALNATKGYDIAATAASK